MTPMTPWLAWQLADSALPTGAFAHSGGLEAAVQLGRCRGAAGLDRLVEEALWQAGSLALPFVAAAARAPERLAALDARCDAATPGTSRTAPAAPRGGRCSAPDAPSGPRRRRSRTRSARAGLAGHLAPVWGALLARLGAGAEEACRLHLFTAARGMVSAGVRLGLLGPLEAQGALSRAGAVAEAVLAATAGRPPRRRPRPRRCSTSCSPTRIASTRGSSRADHARPLAPLRPRPRHASGPGAFHERDAPRTRHDLDRRAFTVGVGGPVGSGKTALVLALCRLLRETHSLGVVTNDIFTREDAEFLVRNEALPPSGSARWRPAAARTRPSART